jgi:hypothetical protein
MQPKRRAGALTSRALRPPRLRLGPAPEQEGASQTRRPREDRRPYFQVAAELPLQERGRAEELIATLLEQFSRLHFVNSLRYFLSVPRLYRICLEKFEIARKELLRIGEAH